MPADPKASSGPPLRAAGIVGGASSGKSTLFNNLLGGRHASQVTMMSHTTKGPVLAVHLEAEETLADWLDGDRLFMPRLARRTARPDDRTPGQVDTLTVTSVSADLPPELLLLDTPDFTSQAALLEGDRTRNMLCWFDCVLVVVDEDRWFDRQTFGWLRDRLDRYDLPRLVAFNRNERSDPLTDTDLARLAQQAARLRAEHVLLDHVPGRGLRTLPDEMLSPIREWLARPDQTRSPARHRARLQHLLADRANHLLNANQQRFAWLERLGAALDETVRREMKAEATLAFDVLMSASQARLLSPYWQSLIRPGTWLAERTSSLFRRLPGMGLLGAAKPTGSSAGPAEPDDMIARGAAFFAAEVTRVADHLLLCASQSPLFKAAPLPAGQLQALRPDPATLEEQGRRQAQHCRQAFDRFVEVIERSAAELNLKLAASGGLLAGALLGAVLTAPAGGFGMPVGALIGAAVGAPATGLSARSLMRLYKTLARTPERRHLWDAVKAYRTALGGPLEAVRERILHLGRSKTLDESDPLHKALAVLRDSDHGEARP